MNYLGYSEKAIKYRGYKQQVSGLAIEWQQAFNEANFNKKISQEKFLYLQKLLEIASEEVAAEVASGRPFAKKGWDSSFERAEEELKKMTKDTQTKNS